MLTEKRKKFITLAEKRVGNTLKQIALIENLARRSAYDYSQEDIKKIFNALEGKLRDAKGKFEAESRINPRKLHEFSLEG